jgi:hypothetical protein
MNRTKTRKSIPHFIHSLTAALTLAAAFLLGAARAQAQCTEILSDLREPIGSGLTDQGNLLIAESGNGEAHTGRLSLVDPQGNRRTLLDGLPSAPADVGDPSGPTGFIMRGRTLYLLMGVGDVGIMGPRPGTTLENPNGPSSPIFSSILAIHISPFVERNTAGFTLAPADEQTLADGQIVTLSNGGRDRITIQLVVDFPNFIPFPLPDVPDNIEVSNPFGLAAIGKMLYATDGGRNHLWQVDLMTGAFSPLVAFPDIPNPLFPNLGGPFLQAVPTGIAAVNGQLLVTLLRGAPFPTGTSTVEQIDPQTGSDTEFISNLTTAIDIRPFGGRFASGYLVLEASSEGPFFAGPGTVLRVDDPANPPVVLADCLTPVPSSMTYKKRNKTLYVTQTDGKLIAIPLQ